MKRIATVDVPQANSLSLVGDLLALADQGIVDKERLSKELPLVPREVDYYMHAARILGFAEFKEGKAGKFVVTQEGRAYLSAETPAERRALLVQAIHAGEVFKELFQTHGEQRLDKASIVAFLREATTLNTTTARRRADTMLAWLRHIRDANAYEP